MIPIPNFMPGNNMGLEGAFGQAMKNAMGSNGGAGSGAQHAPMQLAARCKHGRNISPNVLANVPAVRAALLAEKAWAQASAARWQRDVWADGELDRPDHLDRFAQDMEPERRCPAAWPL